MVRNELAAFIRNAREVITDPAAEHQLIDQRPSRVRASSQMRRAYSPLRR
jgi:hypothetical protein